ncbi:MAG: tRNA wybutosine-synthesizing 3 family protein [Candidatus Pacearchaeota archaeon]|nr:tRNA wybutosine-synthesizing 3 family protein [Candidatus Pacearchaeota archaeon]
MDFEKQKQNILQKRDKSTKKSIDERIKKLCNKINSNPNYYTTSSCAGRIILLKNSDKKARNLILFSSHDKINFSRLKKQLKEIKKQDVNFKQEPCILHVGCRSIADANDLVEKARFAGWKKSGIITAKKRIVCELLSTENMEFPIIRKGKLLVDDYFLKIIVKEANKKLERTWKKIKKLESLV